MKQLLFFLLLCPAVMIAGAQTPWPQPAVTPEGAFIKLYQPTPDSLRDNRLSWRAAFSIQEDLRGDPQFGSYQAWASIETDKDERLVRILSVNIRDIALPSMDPAGIRKLKPFLEQTISSMEIVLSLDELLSQLDMATAEKDLSADLNTLPPRIIYSNSPSILVLIDGAPQTRYNDELGVDAVVNTPYTILKTDNTWYLYGGKHWYIATIPTGPYMYVPSVPEIIRNAQQAIDIADSASAGHGDTAREGADRIARIIVSTTPAELIQSNGEAQYAPIAGTGLLYLTNSDNDVFIDTGSQTYYVLFSGRWYKSSKLEGPWEFAAADALPGDFARIPEGSAKDRVLASVAGTEAAREAVTEAQIPQTARVGRTTRPGKVTYDGSPQFVQIRGTRLEYAVNTPETVLRYSSRYYYVENGIWFVSNTAHGPWKVADTRPGDLDMIPPDYPVYNCKYAYIYDVTPDYVWMGYTPGYLNSFIFGPTVVYGTGFYYDPWWGSSYYPRPWTWGFHMWYDPWFGWTFGYDLGLDWFNFGIDQGFWAGGWWGPWGYRPPYIWHHFRGHGLYEHDVRRVSSADHRVNLYSSRRGIVNHSPAEHVYTDRNGNIFRQDGNGGWQQRDGIRWRPLDGRSAPMIRGLERQQQLSARGQMRVQNFQQFKGGRGYVRPGKQ